MHLFPQVREALLDVVKEMAPQAWVRQCGARRRCRDALWDCKALVLDVLSQFRALAAAAWHRDQSGVCRRL